MMAWLLAAAAAASLAAVAPAIAAPAPPEPPAITGVEIVSPHRVPEARVQAVIGSLAGQPRLRGVIRDSLERLWGLGVFESVRVEEIPEPGGVRLRYVLTVRPSVREVRFRGDLGVDVAQVAAAARLGRGAAAGPEGLERARRDVLALYEREGYVDAEVRVDTAVDPATNARDVTFVIRAGARPEVRRVRVNGGARQGPEFVRKAFRVDEEDEYRPTAVRDGVEAVERAYRERGFFEIRVRVARERTAREAVDLVVTVEEGPHTRVEFDGAEAVDVDTLRARLTFADARIVDETEVQVSARQVQVAYAEQGYALARVEGTLTRTDGDAVVRFRIDEGPRVAVDAVEFPGSPLPPGRLAEVIETRASGRLRDQWLRRDIAVRDAQALEAFLRARGHADARVRLPEIEFSPDRRRARVRFPIEAGPRVTVGRVSVTGARVFPDTELLRELPLREGQLWTEAQVEEGRRQLERKYARAGFHGAEVTVGGDRHDSIQDVGYAIVEGERTRIARILVRGLAATREHVVLRELRFAVGDPLDPEQLVDAQRDLTKLGLFEGVDVEPLRPPPAPFADVVVTVRERKPWRIDLGAGYTTYEGVRGSLELGNDNLFGTGRGLTLRGRVSERGDREEIGYVEPWVFGTRFRGETTLFRERRDEIGFSYEKYGITLGVSRDVLEHLIDDLWGSIRYELSEIDRFDIDPSLTTEDVKPGSERIATLTPELRLDRRDDIVNPQRGSYHLVSLRGGGGFLGGDADFVKSRLETIWFLDRIIPRTVLVLVGRLGLAAPILGDDSLPIEERFFAGGANTIRGYRERRVGPLDAEGNPTGGNAQLIFNVEWRFPIWRIFDGALFVDSGMVAAEVDQLDLAELVTGAGAGLRVRTPVGPIRVDAAYPLDEIPENSQKLRFYLTFGYTF